jgi:hypothetical protein
MARARAMSCMPVPTDLNSVISRSDRRPGAFPPTSSESSLIRSSAICARCDRVSRFLEHPAARIEHDAIAALKCDRVELALIAPGGADRIYMHAGPQPFAEQDRHIRFHRGEHDIASRDCLLGAFGSLDFHPINLAKIPGELFTVVLGRAEDTGALDITRSMHGLELGSRLTTFLMKFSLFGFHGWQFMYLVQETAVNCSRSWMRSI